MTRAGQQAAKFSFNNRFAPLAWNAEKALRIPTPQTDEESFLFLLAWIFDSYNFRTVNSNDASSRKAEVLADYPVREDSPWSSIHALTDDNRPS